MQCPWSDPEMIHAECVSLKGSLAGFVNRKVFSLSQVQVMLRFSSLTRGTGEGDKSVAWLSWARFRMLVWDLTFSFKKARFGLLQARKQTSRIRKRHGVRGELNICMFYMNLVWILYVFQLVGSQGINLMVIRHDPKISWFIQCFNELIIYSKLKMLLLCKLDF